MLANMPSSIGGSSSPTTLLQAGATQQLGISCVIFHNRDTSNTIDVHIHAGATVDDTSKLFKVDIEPNDSFVFNTEKLVLGPNQKLAAWSDHGSSSYISITTSFIEL